MNGRYRLRAADCVYTLDEEYIPDSLMRKVPGCSKVEVIGDFVEGEQVLVKIYRGSLPPITLRRKIFFSRRVGDLTIRIDSVEYYFQMFSLR